MKKYYLLILLISLLSACSSTEQTTNSSAVKESYVFDDTASEIKEIPLENKSENVIETPKTVTSKFIVQIAAFSTEERADQFIFENKSKLNMNLIKKYSEKVKLFVVQLHPFSTREEAENVRNSLWEIESFKDAFITQ
ncbi:MAG: hypothetical protein CO129_03225 [Ignavibacteriales bacterium CG_4_9_14_3_um_filter_34_10]|nr:MAG: hypothetical protein CO129_03225 [Ignavibacteriales bacterium CG_4_9_14_3_um_filter_34_10]